MTNSTNVTSELAVGWYLPADIPNLIVLTLIAVLGMANLGLILCFVHNKSLRKPFNYIVLGMAVGNFSMSDVAAVMEIVLITRQFVPFGAAWCHLLIFLSSFSYTQSMLFITLMAVIRTWSGLSTYQTTFSAKRMVICVVIVYVLSTTWGVLWNMRQIGDFERCMDLRGEHTSTLSEPYIIMVIVLFVITVCSYVTLILWMYCKTSMAGNRKSEILTLKASLAVTVLFIVCYLLPIVAGYMRFDMPASELLNVVNVFHILAYVQSALNPYFYLATNSHFREIYKKTCYKALPCCTQRPRAVSDSSNTNNITNSNTTRTSNGNEA